MTRKSFLAAAVILVVLNLTSGSASAARPVDATAPVSLGLVREGKPAPILWRGEEPLICFMRRSCPDANTPEICLMGRLPQLDLETCRTRRFRIDLVNEAQLLDHLKPQRTSLPPEQIEPK